MANPPPDNLGETYHHSARLLHWAVTWDEQSLAMLDIAKEISDLRVGVYGGDFYHGVITLYNRVAAEIETWAHEGRTEMRNIAEELVSAAKRYGTTEEEIIRLTHGDLS